MVVIKERRALEEGRRAEDVGGWRRAEVVGADADMGGGGGVHGVCGDFSLGGAWHPQAGQSESPPPVAIASLPSPLSMA